MKGHLNKIMNVNIRNKIIDCSPYIIAIILMGINIFLNRNLSFRGDSYEIWEVTKTFLGGENSYHSFVEYRGVGCFFVFSIIYKFSQLFQINDILFLRTINSILFILMNVYFIPQIFNKIFKCRIGIFNKIVFIVICYLFFRGYFLYPSNDVMGTFFTILSFFLICILSKKLFFIKLILSAFFLIIASQMRSNFIILIPFFLICIFLKIKELNYSNKSFEYKGMFTFIISIILFILIFRELENIYDIYFRLPFIYAETISNSRKGVFVRALGWGIMTQKAEWNIGPNYDGSIYYIDKIGTYLFEQEFPNEINMNNFTLMKYVQFIIKYPLDMLTLYGRHLFIVFDIKYPSVYINDMNKGPTILSFINYTFIFLSVIFFRVDKAYRNNKLFRCFTMSLIILVISSLPVIQETRFVMLPLLIIYSVAIFGFAISAEYKLILKKREVYVYMLIFIFVMFTISSLFAGYLPYVIG